MKSRFTILTLLAIVFASINSNAQYDGARDDRYIRLSLVSGMLIPVISGPKDLSVSFPYTIPDANGLPANHQFNGGLKKAFSTVPSYFGLNTDLGYHNHFYTFQFDLTWNSFSSVPHGIISTALGYGYNWMFKNGKLEKASNPDPKLIMISASLSGALINRQEHLGTIDDEGITVTALGKEISPDYQTNDEVDGKYKYVTHHSKQIIAVYSQTGYGLMPQIAFSTSPFRTRFHAEFDVSCFVPLLNSSGIKLYQTDGDNEDYVTSSHGFNKNEVTVTAGGNTYTHSPFSMFSVQMGIKVGIQGSWHKKGYFSY